MQMAWFGWETLPKHIDIIVGQYISKEVTASTDNGSGHVL